MIAIAQLIGLLTVIFAGLKLVDFIDWPWPWVVSPIWIAVCILLLAIILILKLDWFDWEDEW